MPFIADYSEDEDQAPTGGGGGRLRGGGVSGAAGATPSKQVEPDFVPWDRFVSANQEVSQREAGKLAGNVETQAQDVSARRDTATEKQTDAVNQNYAGYQPKEKPQAVSAFGKPSAQAFGQNGVEQSQMPAGATATDGASDWSAFVRPPEPAAPQKPKPPASAPDGGMGAATADGPAQGERELGAQVPPQSLGELRRGEGLSLSEAASSKLWDATKQLDKDKLWHNPATGKSEGFELSGWKSLEDQLGKAGWEDLVGDTRHADEAATMLGDESGVEALLDQQYGNATGFDAALVGGAGGERFRDLAEQYGSGALTGALSDAATGARSEWERLMGDVGTAGAARDAEIDAYTAAMPKAGSSKTRPKVNVSPYATSPAGATAWLESAMAGGYGDAASDLDMFQQWANAIYGEGADLNKLLEDMQRMTWEEFDAFRNGTVPSWMGLGANATGFYGLGETEAQAQISAARDSNGFGAYAGANTPGAVNTLGTQEQFLEAMANGSAYGDGINWNDSPTVQQQAQQAASALGISVEALVQAVQRMTPEEYQNFWILGVIPEWMTGVTGYAHGVVGGWQSPFLQGAMSYGQDGGMWNAVTNMWKDSVMTVLEGIAGGPAGAIEAGGKFVEKGLSS